MKEIDCTGVRAATPNEDSKNGGVNFFRVANKTESFSSRGVRENFMQYATISRAVYFFFPEKMKSERESTFLQLFGFFLGWQLCFLPTFF